MKDDEDIDIFKEPWRYRIRFWAGFLVYMWRTLPADIVRLRRAEARAVIALQRRSGRAQYNWSSHKSFAHLLDWQRIERDLEVARDETNDLTMRSMALQSALDRWIKRGFTLALFRNYPRHPMFVSIVRMYRVMLLESRRNGGPALLDYAENGTPLPL